VESPLPTGTLTLLFSDIEGSTSLLNRLGNDRYASALSTQRSICRAAFAQWQGREMGTEGDSFFVVFTSVGDAVNAAVHVQRELGRHSWPAGEPVRVRIGLHTGEPTRHEDGYVGMDVHHAARVASSAHGGQIVVSDATERIAAALAHEDVAFVDLGLHRLKDLPQDERLHQVVAEGLLRDFPPVRSLGARANLPVPPTSLVGREGELQELQELLTGSGVRLVTLTGPGGSGKTRLGIAAAASLDAAFPDGVYFVPLETATSAEVMLSSIADALGVTGESRAPPTFLEYMATRRALLVLDNLEQLPAASDVVRDLLGAAPGLFIVATSRRPLHLVGEYEHPVPPLTLPAGHRPEEAAGSGAVRLFVQRARMVRPSFALTAENSADVAEICRRLDGLPLAIELAAARTKLLSPRAVLARLDTSLELTGRLRDRPTRQQTLRATVEWSYRLLTREQQQFFRQLGVFDGDFGLDAVAAVASGNEDSLDQVDDLVDASLASVRDGYDGEPRVHLLQTIASYAREQLAAEGELEAVRRRHAEYYLSLVEDAAPRLRHGEYLSARDRIEAEMDNLRAALSWAFSKASGERSPDPAALITGLRLCQALSWFWYVCGYQSEGMRWLSRAVGAAEGSESRELMTALHGLGVLLVQQGEAERARDALLRCLEYWRRLDDRSKIAMELNSLGVVQRALGESASARATLEESIAVARAAKEKGRLANALCNLAMVEVDEGTPERAVDLLHEALAIDRELGDAWGESIDNINLVRAMLMADRLHEARRHLLVNAAPAIVIGDIELSINVIELFAMVFAELDDAPAAARMLGAAQAMRGKAELPITAPDAATLERCIDKVRSRPDPRTWEANLGVGASYSVEAALADATGG
jgi:predicted ATPase/class 3 adenylate cyclase